MTQPDIIQNKEVYLHIYLDRILNIGDLVLYKT